MSDGTRSLYVPIVPGQFIKFHWGLMIADLLRIGH